MLTQCLMFSQKSIFAFVGIGNRYGVPSTIYSDNAKTFLSLSMVLQEIFTSSEF